jgi:hypothetical protein
MTASQSALPILQKVMSLVMPALFTRISTGPTSATTRSTKALLEGKSVTSQA